MARKTITVDRLGAEVNKILEEYAGDITKNLPEITEKVGKKGVTALKNSTKSAVNGNKYWKGWRSQAERTRMGAKVTIYNGKLPGLAHLLEHGHAKRGGGRTPAHVHIAPVETKINEEYERKVIDDIKRNS